METTSYYQFGNGSVAERTTSGHAGDVPPPDGAVEITRDEYLAVLADIKEANDAEVQEHLDAEAQRAHDDYQALIAAGIPEATARRLSGYRGETEA